MPKKKWNEINLSFQLNEWMNEPKKGDKVMEERKRERERESEHGWVQLKIQFQKMYCTWNAFRTSDILHMNPCQITARSLPLLLRLPLTLPHSPARSLSHLFGYLLVSFFAGFFLSKLQTVGSRWFTRRMFRFLRFVIFQQLPSYRIQFTCKGWLHSHSNIRNRSEGDFQLYVHKFWPKPHSTISRIIIAWNIENWFNAWNILDLLAHWMSLNSIFFHGRMNHFQRMSSLKPKQCNFAKLRNEYYSHFSVWSSCDPV